METLGEYADIEAALNAAEVATYSISGRKVCKTCKAAAEDLLNARAEHAAEVAAAKSEAEALAARPLPGTESLSRIFDRSEARRVGKECQYVSIAVVAVSLKKK